MNKLPSVFMILYDIDSLGGAEQQAWRLARGLRDRGVRVAMVTGDWKRQKPDSKMIENIPVHYIPTASRLVAYRGGRRLSRYVMFCTLTYFIWRHQKEYDILHFHESSFLTIAGILIGWLINKKVITKMRASGEWSDLQYIRRDWRGLEKPFLISMLRRINRVISLNEESTQELLANGFQPDQIISMVNGIEVDNFTPRLHYTLSIPPKLVFVGRLEPQKDVKTLLQALTLTTRRDIEALIVGDGYQRQYLENLVIELGLQERVKFYGRVSDVVPLLQKADLFVLPSLAEGISNALLEAMSCGLPCVVTDIPGNRTVLTDQTDGYLFMPGKAEVLAHTLDHLLSDEALRSRLGQAARNTVMQRFAMNAIVESYLNLYCQLVLAN
jgi:glycosyltransferase involved in cell wall biosynthesis